MLSLFKKSTSGDNSIATSFRNPSVFVLLLLVLFGCSRNDSDRVTQTPSTVEKQASSIHDSKDESWWDSGEIPDNAAMMLGQTQPYEGVSGIAFSPDSKTVVSWGGYFMKRRVSDGEILFEKDLSLSHGEFLDETRFFGCTRSAGFIVDDEVKQQFLLSRNLMVSSVAVSGIYGDVVTGLSQQSGSPNQTGAFGMATADGSIRYWSAKDGSYRHEIHPELGTIHHIALLPPSRRIAIVGDDAFELWSYLDGKHTRLASVEKPTDAVLALPIGGGGWLALARNDVGVIDIWEASTGKLVATKVVGQNEAKAVSFDILRNVIYGGDSGRINFWDVKRDEIVLVVETDAQVTAVAASPDGRHLAASTRRGERDRGSIKRDDLRIWRLHPLKELTKRPGRTNAVTDLCFTSDGKRIVTASGDQTAMDWHAESGNPLRQIGGFPAPTFGESFTSISLTADSHSVIISQDQQLTQVNLAGQRQVRFASDR
jgi:WD40 repeat protein